MEIINLFYKYWEKRNRKCSRQSIYSPCINFVWNHIWSFV